MKKVTIYQELSLLLPKGQLGDWDVFEYWERERFESMKQHLKAGDLMLDIGTEHGWLAALYQKYLNLQMILVEPTPEFWPNIKAIWKANELETPLACYQGFAANDSQYAEGALAIGGWPAAADGELLRSGMPYRYLHNHTHRQIASMMVSFMPAMCDTRPPDCLNIDVEGAELEVLRGAKVMLERENPLVWVSVHEDLMQRDYDTKPQKLHEFMQDLGYAGTHLATDHEQHWLYKKED